VKIKSINKTNQYKHVDFGMLAERWNKSRVLTPTGFEEVKAFDLIKRDAPTLLLSIDNGMEIKCDPNHKIVCESYKSDSETSEIIEKFVKDLDPGTDKLIGYGGQRRSFEVRDGGTHDLYDIEICSPHLYYTAGVLSHNSIMLVNNAIANSKKSKNVLYITLELSHLKSALRGLGALSNKSIVGESRFDNKDDMIDVARKVKASGAGDIVFYQYPPEEIDVDTIYALIDTLRKNEKWHPDVVIIDYLELMLSRRDSDNSEDYIRQKNVSTQIRGLAINENVCVFTATQTNRSGNDDSKMIDVTKISESYGKSMAMDYLISINQSPDEYSSTPAQARLYVAKNRNGPKFISIPIKINYKTMSVKEIDQ